FVSPVAYVVLTLYTLLAGFFFLLGVVSFIETLRQAQAFQAFDYLAQMNLNDALITPFLGSMSVVLIFVIPGITMGLFASEKANGTDELLLTSPLTIWDVVLGKYLAAAVFVLILGLLVGFYPAVLFQYGDPELGKTLAGLLGLTLMGLAYAAVGCFASSVTRSQMIAFILAFVILLLLLIMGAVAELGAMGGGARLEGFLSYLSVGEHFENLSQGLVDTLDVSYFLVVIAVSLLLTKASIESVRWR
ncbi:MAG: ABC transporter permease subunit, partial [Myxococcales bacterium]|nr:ABC transporter permease subunit [Myxococcales bacterium]